MFLLTSDDRMKILASEPTPSLTLCCSCFKYPLFLFLFSFSFSEMCHGENQFTTPNVEPAQKVWLHFVKSLVH